MEGREGRDGRTGWGERTPKCLTLLKCHNETAMYFNLKKEKIKIQ